MNVNSDRTPVPVEDVCLICGKQRLLRTSWTDPNPVLLRKTNKLEIEIAKSRARERKMKMYLAATWIIFAGVVFGNKVFAF
ncbi:hypothetical protein RHGRI_036769 [Rhododendron griersonianum]|uniref:Transmembrane protein n=1 Tax=Rhododendron griersonianum TaxID=479676 RepID=A0AAV6HPZ9_9ERIC|nr:hypothetical protein RHGRI_036769 [Rhododendron griersonianum]